MFGSTTDKLDLSPILLSGAMVRWEPAQIAGLMLRCGRIALGKFRNFKWVLKKDKSLLTEADTAVERQMARRFDRPAKGIRMIGEETSEGKSDEYVEQALGGKCWIVDPVDGTAPFACNVPTWGISIGYAENSIHRHGCIFLPYFGEMFMTAGDASYCAEGVDCSRPREKIRFRKLRHPAAKFARGGLVSVSQDATKRGTLGFDNPVQAVCCTVYTVAGLLKGRYSAYVGSSKLWDMAGALPILLNAGFAVELRNGCKIGRAISETNCLLRHRNANSRWRYRDNFLIAPDRRTIREIKKKIAMEYPYK